MDAFQSTLQNSAYAALDTECIVARLNHRILSQVGLAYSPSLAPISADPVGSERSLENFAKQRAVSSTTINVAFDTVEPGTSIPGRMRQRFGNECTCVLDHLDGLVDKYLTGYSDQCRSQGKTQLILVLFEYHTEWEYMARHFPSALGHFSAWLDVRDLCREIAPDALIPGLTSTLVPLGYSKRDITLRDFANPENKAHNAGNNAGMTLAALEGLQRPASRDNLRSLQAYRCDILSEQTPPFFFERPFTASIKSFGTSGVVPLPPSLGSAHSVARYFLDEYQPECVSVSAGLQPTCAWITFASIPQLEHFIDRTNGITVDGKSLSITKIHSEDVMKAQRKMENTGSLELKLKLETMLSALNSAFTAIDQLRQKIQTTEHHPLP